MAKSRRTKRVEVSGKQKFVPFLWFDGQALAAAKFYASVFPNSKVTDIQYWGDTGPGKKGSVLTASFTLEGQEFVALNGGPQYKFTPAVSFLVHCKTQKEVDTYWKKLTGGGGKAVQCGWLEDKYGVSWQIVPTLLFDLLGDPDPQKARRAMQAMMGMVKLDIEALKRAHKGK